MTNYTTSEKLACVERELRKRYRNYPRWVAEGKMTERDAANQIAIMEAIAVDLREQADKERLPL